MSERWEPDLYLEFADQRARPARELLARIPVQDAASVVDLGCGPGNITPLLRARWPTAAYVGVDRSAEMLERAAARHPDLRWIQADAAGWKPDGPVDVVYSNAALHWVDDHETVLPRLVGALSPGGALAVQMPSNFAAPTHTCIVDVVRSRAWSVDLGGLLRIRPVRDPIWYHDLLAPLAATVDIWTTTYLQQLEGDDAVTRWVSGSALRPFLTALTDPAEHDAFVAAYRAAIEPHYPRRRDGRTLLPYTRLFVIVTVDA